MKISVQLSALPCKCDFKHSSVFIEAMPSWDSNITQFNVVIYCRPDGGGCGARLVEPITRTNIEFIAP